MLDYKRKIIDMVKDIQNEKVLKLIFGFVKSGYFSQIMNSSKKSHIKSLFSFDKLWYAIIIFLNLSPYNPIFIETSVYSSLISPSGFSSVKSVIPIPKQVASFLIFPVLGIEFPVHHMFNVVGLIPRSLATSICCFQFKSIYFRKFLENIFFCSSVVILFSSFQRHYILNFK